MDTETDVCRENQTNWALPMLGLVVWGTSLEIAVAAGLALARRAGFIPVEFDPIVDYFIYGATAAGFLAMLLSLLYLRIRSSLKPNHDS